MANPFERFATSDAAKFCDSRSFGELVTYTPSGAGAVEISANVSNPFAFENPGGSGIGDHELTMLVQAADVPDLAKADSFVRAESSGDVTVYYPISWEPDGFGNVLVFLSKTAIS